MKQTLRLLIAALLMSIAGTGFCSENASGVTIEPEVVTLGNTVLVTGSFSSSAEVGAVVVLSHKQPATFRKKVKLVSAGLKKTADDEYTFSAKLPTRKKQGDEALVSKHLLRLVLLDPAGEKIKILELGKLEVVAQ